MRSHSFTSHFVKITLAVQLVFLFACSSTNRQDTLASLERIEFQVKEEQVDSSLEKAMASYEKFLKETPETEMTPEALRRLADLKIQKEYNLDFQIRDADDPAINDPAVNNQAINNAGINAAEVKKKFNKKLPAAIDKVNTPVKRGAAEAVVMQVPSTKFKPVVGTAKDSAVAANSPIADVSENEKIFSDRAVEKIDLGGASRTKNASLVSLDATDEERLHAAGANEAIEIYKGLIKKYPFFERNDQVLYQLSRAYEEIGQIDIAMETLEKLIADYPESRHIDEAQFRRAEYFFTRKKYLSSEEAYQFVINAGEASAFYELALYKQGWAFFKQDMYEEALQDFLKMLDYKIDNGYELDNIDNKIEKKRIDDTYRVISLSFSYLGGAESIVEYFDKYGHKHYEASVYSHLGEHFLTKRRYSDAASAYETYVEKNPMSKEAPYFNMRVIEIYKDGGFPRLIVEAKKEFAKTYSVRSDYWTFFDINENADVLAFLKSNLVDLANHYHALYQNPKFVKKKEDNYQEAIFWYREYLASFEKDVQSAKLNNQLAGLLLENKDYLGAAQEYERTAYDYPGYDESASAGYAAIYAYREHLKIVSQSQRNDVKREIIRSSIKFSDIFPENENAAVVLVAAVDDLYELEDYEQAIVYGRRVITDYPNADKKILRSAWTVVAHASFDTADYVEAEKAYIATLSLTDKADEKYNALSENLAASVYKQGEQARSLGDHKTAAEHFLRVAQVAPNSKIRPTAEYDAAAALIQLKEWATVSAVLEGFRVRYPEHELLPDITKKLAVVYKEDKQYQKAAEEFERIEKENPDDESLRREVLAEAAELYEKVKLTPKVLAVYLKIADYFPKPIEGALEVRHKISEIYLSQTNDAGYISELNKIVSIDAAGGEGRTERTKYLAGNAALILAEPKLALFQEVALVEPFQQNLTVKKQRMRDAIKTYNKLVEYQVGNVTAAATYYIAEIYYEFNVALVKSERPTNLSEEELEEYELVIEEQAYPFEEKAIEVHEKNMELLDVDIYNKWIDKSIARLAIMLPARYAKTEEASMPVMLIQPKREVENKQIKSKQKSSDSLFTSKLYGDNLVSELVVAVGVQE